MSRDENIRGYPTIPSDDNLLNSLMEESYARYLHQQRRGRAARLKVRAKKDRLVRAFKKHLRHSRAPSMTSAARAFLSKRGGSFWAGPATERDKKIASFLRTVRRHRARKTADTR